MSEPIFSVTLTPSSRAEFLAHETLLLVAQAYSGRTDYRIVGGQMVMLLQKVYPDDVAIETTIIIISTVSPIPDPVNTGHLLKLSLSLTSDTLLYNTQL